MPFFSRSGRVVEEGNHAELLAMGGRYAELWHMQSDDQQGGSPLGSD